MRRHTIGDGEPIVIDFKKSCHHQIFDKLSGKYFLDCSTQFASLPLGWNHPKLEERMRDCLEYVVHKPSNSDYYSEALAEFTDKFASIAPDFKHFFFVEGGTLGVENALKAAFDWKMKKLGWGDEKVNELDVIHLKQAFHGRSGYTLSLTNTVPNKTALFPKFNWTRIENPKLRFPVEKNEVAILEEISLRKAEEALRRRPVAAIILETIQGEGGDNHFRPEYFRALRELADKYEAMLILDEVQCGVGLTGKMWAYEHFGVVPDMMAFGKKTQVCGFCSTSRIDEVPDNVFRQSSRINSTWGGNLLDMIRFGHIIDIIREENLIHNAAVVGEAFLTRLEGAAAPISNVRGQGLMIAFDLETSEQRDAVLGRMLQKMTALPCGEKSIRLRPALNFYEDHIKNAIRFISDAVYGA